jgi:hypothetical protein
VEVSEPTLQERLEALHIANGQEAEEQATTREEPMEAPVASKEHIKENRGMANVPTTDSLQAVLEQVYSFVSKRYSLTSVPFSSVQALHTNDKQLLESVLAVSNPTVVANTMQRLPQDKVLPFLNQLIAR